MKGLAGLPDKAAKAGVGQGPGIVAKCQTQARAVEEQASAVDAALAEVNRALDADGAEPPPAQGGSEVLPEGDAVAMATGGTEGTKGEKKKKKDKGKAPGGGEEMADCTLEVVQEAVEGDCEISKPVLKGCAALSAGSANYPEINLGLAKCFHRKSRRGAECKALANATEQGQYKYDPMVLFSLMKCLLMVKKYRPALEVKDRILQVKDRFPPDVRKTKICEMYSLFAQGYEQLFYKEHGEDPDGDHLPLLENAIDMWERYVGYCGGDAKAKKALQDLKKMKEELLQ